MKIVSSVLGICLSVSTISYTPPASAFFGSNTCGLPLDVYQSIKSKYRGTVDGGYDEDGDGRVDHIEAFTAWDYAQMMYVMHTGIEHQPYTWTNIDTCYKFHATPSDFFEDKSQPILWQTCRLFKFHVIDPKGNRVGGESRQKACRNFGTQEWTFL